MIAWESIVSRVERIVGIGESVMSPLAATEQAVRGAVNVPVIASGGAGAPEHFAPAVVAGADAVLAASVFHFRELTIDQVKKAMSAEGIVVR